jgi:hypothetical protein
MYENQKACDHLMQLMASGCRNGCVCIHVNKLVVGQAFT